jgi:hypothetical protein
MAMTRKPGVPRWGRQEESDPRGSRATTSQDRRRRQPRSTGQEDGLLVESTEPQAERGRALKSPRARETGSSWNGLDHEVVRNAVPEDTRSASSAALGLVAAVGSRRLGLVGSRDSGSSRFETSADLDPRRGQR